MVGVAVPDCGAGRCVFLNTVGPSVLEHRRFIYVRECHRHIDGIGQARSILNHDLEFVVTVAVLVAGVFVVEGANQADHTGAGIDGKEIIIGPLDHDGIGLSVTGIHVGCGRRIGGCGAVFSHGTAGARGQQRRLINVGQSNRDILPDHFDTV